MHAAAVAVDQPGGRVAQGREQQVAALVACVALQYACRPIRVQLGAGGLRGRFVSRDVLGPFVRWRGAGADEAEQQHRGDDGAAASARQEGGQRQAS